MKTFGESLIQSLPNGLIILDRKNEIAYLNKSGENILGITAAEVIGQELDQVLLSIDGSSLLAAKPIQIHSDFNFEATVILPNEEELPLGYNITPYTFKQRKFSGKALHFRDLTAIRKMNWI